MRRTILGLVVALWSTPVSAMCFEEAGARYGIEPDLLKAIGWVESRWRQVTAGNTDGSRDICLMQVNSWWLPKLEPHGIGEAELMGDACLCVNVGAWILAQEVASVGYTWKAAAQYHSRTPRHQQRYVAAVREALRSIRVAKGSAASELKDGRE